jgi:Family of unknown function (DUF5336)
VIVVYTPTNRDFRADTESHLPRNLLIVVAVLGLATYAVSFGPVINGAGSGDWYVRFAALSGLVAAFALTPKGKPWPMVTAALAAMGFLDALSSTVLATDRGWALTAIVVLNALQTAAAVAALLIGPTPTTDNSTAGYEAYVDYYNQAVRNYYNQQAHSAPAEQSQHSGHGQAYADAQAAPRVQRAQRSSQYADYSELDYGGSRGSAPQDHDLPGAAPGRPAGLPSFGQAPSYADQTRRDTGESAPPSSPY